MQITTENILSSKYQEYPAVFFTDDGILVGDKTSSPFLPFGKTTTELKLIIESVYLDHSILFVRCHTSLSLEKILHNGFQIHNEKSFLNSINKEETQAL